MQWQSAFRPPKYYPAITQLFPRRLNSRSVFTWESENKSRSHTLPVSTNTVLHNLFRFVHWPLTPIYKTVNGFGVGKIILMFLKEASYAHHGCIYLIKYSNIVKYHFSYYYIITEIILIYVSLSILKTAVLLHIFVDSYFLMNRKFKRTAFIWSRNCNIINVFTVILMHPCWLKVLISLKKSK